MRSRWQSGKAVNSFVGDRPVVFADADNTLWDTDDVYARAQVDLLKTIEFESGIKIENKDRLAFVRSLDQALAEKHRFGLRYPPRCLARALILVMTGVPEDIAIDLSLRENPIHRLSKIAEKR